jgi:hypothetical protein
MRNLRVHEVLNPNGILGDDRIRWTDGVHIIGSRRELLYLACSTKTMNPSWDVVVGFNPRAHLFDEVRHIFLMAEKLLSHADAASEEGHVGGMGGEKTGSEHGFNPNELVLTLRATVMYLFGALCAVLPERDERRMEKAFDYLSSVSQQKDELLPIMVESFLGKEFRTVYETLCDDYYYRRSEKQVERREWLYQAEKVLSDACMRPFNVAWKMSLSSPLYVNGGSTLRRPSGTALFLPMFSTNRIASGQSLWNLDDTCSELAHDGCTDFVFYDCFHERLRWVERLSKSRQAKRMAAVKVDPLRSQSFFDSRAGRARVLLLSDASLDFVESLLNTVSIAQFSIPVQEILDTALEVGHMRRSFQLGPDPVFDLLALHRALAGPKDKLRGDASDVPKLETLLATLDGEQKCFSFAE